MSKNTDLGNLVNGLFVDSSRRVGIGTTSPSVALDVVGAGRFSGELTGTSAVFSSNVTATLQNSTNKEGFIVKATTTSAGGSQPAYTYYTAAGSKRWASFLNVGDDKYHISNASNTELFTITQAGNFGIGTTNPTTAGGGYTGLDIRGTTGSSLILGSTTTPCGYIYASSSFLSFETSSTIPILFNPGGSERMRISSNGNVGIGTSNPTFKLDVNGEIVTRGAATAAYSYEDRNNTSIIYAMFAYAGYTNFYNGGNKAQINMSNGVYTALSDVNKKKDFEQSNIGLNEVLQLKPTLYRLKGSEELSPKELGFIAQEVKEFIPQAYSENGEFIGLNQMPIIAALTKAIQELSAEINILKQK